MKWTQEEMSILQEYPRYTHNQLAKILNRTKESVRHKAKRLNIPSNYKLWTKLEDEIIIKKYGIVPKEELLTLLPNRNWDTIKNRAFKYKIKRENYHGKPKEWIPIKSKYLFYVLGVIEGDGSVYSNGGGYVIGLGATDKAFVEKFHSNIQQIGIPIGEIKAKIKKPYRTVYTVATRCTAFGKWYKKLDYSWILQEMENEEYMFSFIEGMYESDGSFHNTRNISARISNTNRELLDSIKKILEHYKFSPLILTGKTPKKKDYFTLYLCKKKEIKDFLTNKIDCCIKRRQWSVN